MENATTTLTLNLNPSQFDFVVILLEERLAENIERCQAAKDGPDWLKAHDRPWEVFKFLSSTRHQRDVQMLHTELRMTDREIELPTTRLDMATTRLDRAIAVSRPG